MDNGSGKPLPPGPYCDSADSDSNGCILAAETGEVDMVAAAAAAGDAEAVGSDFAAADVAGVVVAGAAGAADVAGGNSAG